MNIDYHSGHNIVPTFDSLSGVENSYCASHNIPFNV